MSVSGTVLNETEGKEERNSWVNRGIIVISSALLLDRSLFLYRGQRSLSSNLAVEVGRTFIRSEYTRLQRGGDRIALPTTPLSSTSSRRKPSYFPPLRRTRDFRMEPMHAERDNSMARPPHRKVRKERERSNSIGSESSESKSSEDHASQRGRSNVIRNNSLQQV
ncbi:hypothetical protein BDN70DRAFT_971610, partial [Pholiota conissans]